MITRRPPFRCLMPALFALSLAGVAAADKGVEVTAASAPAGTDAGVKLALSASIKEQVAQAGLGSRLSGYSISPALIQLRRFIEPGHKLPRTVCVVELGLHDSTRGLVANIRGNASSFGAAQLDTLDAAARAAVDRLPETLSALQGSEHGRARVAGR
jgi:hypothetical protein